jgi:hypothetical protein
MMRDTTRSAPAARWKLVLSVAAIVALLVAAWRVDASALLRSGLDAIAGLGVWGPVIFAVL